MARYNPHQRHDADSIYEAAKAWGERCLVQDTSIFAEGMRLWTPETLNELDKRFVQNLDEGEGDFFEKLEIQLKGGSPDCYRLMAEFLWILMLFQSNIGPSRKQGNVSQVWEWSETRLADKHPYFSNEVLTGLGSAGTAYNTQRWRELSFLITLVRAFKLLNRASREDMLADGWKFAGWLDGLDGSRNRQLRQILPHLLFPELFERISSEKDKRLILASQLGIPERDIRKWDLNRIDKELLELRSKIEKELSRHIDFYEEEFVSIWRNHIRTWLLSWNPNKYAWPNLREHRVKTSNGEVVTLTWPSGLLTPKEGERIYLVRAGVEPQGVVAVGIVAHAPYEASLPSSGKSEPSQEAFFVIDIDFISIRDAALDPILGLASLDKEIQELIQSAEFAGIEIKAKDATKLGRLWRALPPVPLAKHGHADTRAKETSETLNLILYGPPGTGKTYRLMQTYKGRYVDKDGDRYEFVTFHQSYTYEDFIEGIRPKMVDGNITYKVRKGILRRLSERALKDPSRRYALFIDEINRGNVAKIFGEMITLIEADKRLVITEDGQKRGLEVTLPYSGDPFGVPANLDIIATMNTADRSISLLDTALRRRFHFEELMPNSRFIDPQGSGTILDDQGVEINLRELLDTINARLSHLLHRDQTIGHAYFANVKNFAGLRQTMARQIIPLLQEYFYDDWNQIRLVLADQKGEPDLQLIRKVKTATTQELFPGADNATLIERPVFEIVSEAEITPNAIRKIYEPQ